MSFIDEIKEIQNERINKEESVINEIVEFFKTKIESTNFEENLKSEIKYQIEKGKRTRKFSVEFWGKPCSGCSNTYFYCFGVKFSLKDGEDWHEYKGVDLRDIQFRVCEKINEMFIERIKGLGLRIINTKRKDNESRFRYYENEIEIGW